MRRSRLFSLRAIGFRHLLWSAVLAVAVAIAPAITVAEKVKVKAVITTAENINPNSQGRASPVRLLLFQLASADAFNSADFRALYLDEDRAVLGGDLLKPATAQMLQPGQTVEIEEEFEEDTKFLGVLAAFRTLEGAEWRSVVELEAKGFFSLRRSNRLTINVDGRSVTVTVE